LPAYQLTEFLARDRGELETYGARAGNLVVEHGGRLLAVSYAPPCELVEGPELRTVLFLHRWPSREAFWDFYRSDEYQAARHHRLAGSTDGRLLLFEPAMSGV
jgi:uncharacterized protein (DUF1330 family)